MHLYCMTTCERYFSTDVQIIVIGWIWIITIDELIRGYIEAVKRSRNRNMFLVRRVLITIIRFNSANYHSWDKNPSHLRINEPFEWLRNYFNQSKSNIELSTSQYHIDHLHIKPNFYDDWYGFYSNRLYLYY